MLNFKKFLFTSVLTISFSFSVFAQEVEEVVVTATKKEESTQDIAISVEAFTADMLADEQIYDLSDLTEVVPGFGFGKNPLHNMQIMSWLPMFQSLGVPVLLGGSRKSSIGVLSNNELPENRLGGSIALLCYANLYGTQMIRVHDVLESKQAINISTHINKQI